MSEEEELAANQPPLKVKAGQYIYAPYRNRYYLITETRDFFGNLHVRVKGGGRAEANLETWHITNGCRLVEGDEIEIAIADIVQGEIDRK